MRFKTILKIFLGVFILVTLGYVFSGIKGKSRLDYQVNERADGEGMSFSSFNDDNRKALEIKCAESSARSEQKVDMKKIEGLIFRKGKMKKDIKVFGDRGSVDVLDYQTFFVEKNARLVSEDFTILSDNFTLKDKAELSSAAQVRYKTSTLDGTANAGMGLYLKVNTLKFYNTRGTYKRNNRVFDYHTDIMWIIEQEQLMVLEKNAVIRDKHSLMKSDWISVKFDKDMKKVLESSSQKNSYLYIEDPEKNEVKEIKSENIRSLYDKNGRMTRVMVMQNAEVLLRDADNQTLIASDIIDMNFDPDTGKPKDLKIPHRGRIENTGKTLFKVVADTITILYDQNGELSYCEGRGNVDYIIEKYKGTTNTIQYDIKKSMVTLLGEETEMLGSQNSFHSETFNVNTKFRILSTTKGVRSIVRFEKENALFSLEPIFINSGEVTVFEKENRFTYKKQVNLNQGDTVLTTQSLEIQGEDSVIAKGSTTLSFKKEDSDIALKGKEVLFNTLEKRILVKGNAIIKSGETLLRAAEIVIRFNDKGEIYLITGEKNVNFTKNDLSGYSERVNWDFKKEEMVLIGSPYIDRRSSTGDGGTTRGKQLMIDLKTDKITILSGDTNRTETTYRQ